MKKYFICFLILVFFVVPTTILGQEKIEINFFYSQTCPHCATEKSFLEDMEKKYDETKINKLVISENIELLQKFYNNYEVSSNEYGLVPITFVDGKYFVGFNEAIGEEIENCVINKIENGPDEPCAGEKKVEEKTIKIPIIGEINPSDYSFFAVSAILGFFDGFNVCSLGALVLILGLVLALGERKKVLIYGAVFIITAGIIYGFLILLWHQLFSFLATYLRTMEIIIGLLGIMGGVYFFKEFIRFKKFGPTCQVGSERVSNKLFSKIQGLFESSSSLLLITGAIIIFAGIITIVEFPCSAAVPLFFASILASAEMTTFEYLLYIGTFTIFYMIDEIIVFLIAFFTMSIKIASPKFITWLTLIESIVLFMLGFYYILGFEFLL